MLQHFAAGPAMQALPDEAQWNIRQLLARSAAPNVAAAPGAPNEDIERPTQACTGSCKMQPQAIARPAAPMVGASCRAFSMCVPCMMPP